MKYLVLLFLLLFSCTSNESSDTKGKDNVQSNVDSQSSQSNDNSAGGQNVSSSSESTQDLSSQSNNNGTQDSGSEVNNVPSSTPIPTTSLVMIPNPENTPLDPTNPANDGKVILRKNNPN